MSRCIPGRALAGRGLMWPDWAELVLKQLKRQLLHSPQRASAPDKWHVCNFKCIYLLRLLDARAGLQLAGPRLRSAAARQRRDSGCMTVHGSLQRRCLRIARASRCAARFASAEADARWVWIDTQFFLSLSSSGRRASASIVPKAGVAPPKRRLAGRYFRNSWRGQIVCLEPRPATTQEACAEISCANAQHEQAHTMRACCPCGWRVLACCCRNVTSGNPAAQAASMQRPTRPHRLVC